MTVIKLAYRKYNNYINNNDDNKNNDDIDTDKCFKFLNFAKNNMDQNNCLYISSFKGDHLFLAPNKLTLRNDELALINENLILVALSNKCQITKNMSKLLNFDTGKIKFNQANKLYFINISVSVTPTKCDTITQGTQNFFGLQFCDVESNKIFCQNYTYNIKEVKYIISNNFIFQVSSNKSLQYEIRIVHNLKSVIISNFKFNFYLL